MKLYVSEDEGESIKRSRQFLKGHCKKIIKRAAEDIALGQVDLDDEALDIYLSRYLNEINMYLQTQIFNDILLRIPQDLERRN